MKRDIDILCAIKNQQCADSLCHKIKQIIPDVHLVVVPEMVDVLSIISVHQVKLFIVALEVNEVVDPLTYTIASAFPLTLVQFFPVSLLRYAEFAVTTIKLWAACLEYDSKLLHKPLNNDVIKREKMLLFAMPEAVISCNLQGNITYLNRAAERLIGLKKRQMMDKPITSIVEFNTDITADGTDLTLAALLTEDSPQTHCVNAKLLAQNSDHTSVISSFGWLRDNREDLKGLVLVMRMVDRQYVKLYHQANYDELTSLPNRALMNDRSNLAVRLAVRHNCYVGLMFIDLDYFKAVNDAMGHDAGDQMLKSVAKRLISCVRASDTVSRHGGDEFVILLTEVVNLSDCERIAKKILDAFKLPHMVNDKSCVIGLSIGISIFPLDADSSQAMYVNADKAMYAAKASGRNTFEIYHYHRYGL
ncbi:sensor domain-containing diguanylate cyclase [Alteromonas sp. ASW11-36]|uniref:Sensor domain-containing diguanylate cyclase n=1 Tax=Alteromonas arenosi TaxID=3055817 RepID=A0ABT7STA3_9ALTE|nr:sensor domain-containing diguanylate cyclase [Alteromonas sp. ASW11-36]MDM7859418.1 sensor domain-containing diguanylate cyclase [Alteromonas sp. ASW11-36]